MVIPGKHVPTQRCSNKELYTPRSLVRTKLAKLVNQQTRKKEGGDAMTRPFINSQNKPPVNLCMYHRQQDANRRQRKQVLSTTSSASSFGRLGLFLLMEARPGLQNHALCDVSEGRKEVTRIRTSSGLLFGAFWGVGYQRPPTARYVGVAERAVGIAKGSVSCSKRKRGFAWIVILKETP